MWFAAIVSTAVAAVTVAFHWYASGRRRKKKLAAIAPDSDSGGSLISASRVLIVIAHPDDECMFLAPTIMGLIDGGSDVHVLCLSAGNYRRQGLQRKVELRQSCAILGVPPSNLTIMEHTKLPDDPHSLWNKGVIKDILLKTVEKLSIDAVVTFDDYGVSGHPNHVAIFKACQHMCSKGAFPSSTSVYALQSVNVFRKYSSITDTLLSHIDGSTHRYTSTYAQIFTAQRAMLAHRTQLVWFRILYILFSRYLIVNTFRKLQVVPNENRMRESDSWERAEPDVSVSSMRSDSPVDDNDDDGDAAGVDKSLVM